MKGHPNVFSPKRQEIYKERSVIGRVAGDIVLPDPLCSTTHAEMLFDGATVHLKDLGSTNGTKQDGQRVTELVWTPGMSIEDAVTRINELETRIHEKFPEIAWCFIEPDNKE